MSRLPRVVVPGYPHHIVQRGNRRQTVFFDDQDKETYLEILSTHATKAGIEIWAYCLMDNDDWAKYLEEEDNEERDIIVRHTSTGRPLGDETFIDRMEQITGRILRKKKPGQKEREIRIGMRKYRNRIMVSVPGIMPGSPFFRYFPSWNNSKQGLLA